MFDWRRSEHLIAQHPRRGLASDEGMSESNRLQVYKGMENLAAALKQELEYDMKLQNCGVLPDYVNLPSLSASVFAKVLNRAILHPPTRLPF